MTSLRFVGELPLWLGLLLAAVVAVLAWRFYRRESFDLPGRLRWVLPLLRSLAFLLGVLMLTGPVLHHRKVIGTLGQVKIYVDASQSMNMRDQHLSPERQLLIAAQQGWIEPGAVGENEPGDVADSENAAVSSALAMLNQTPRLRRAERSLLETPDALLASLKENHDVELFALVNNSAVKMPVQADAEKAAAFEQSADGSITDLITGITSSRKQSLSDGSTDQPTVAMAAKANTAIVLISDGQHNAGPSPLQAARVLGEQGIGFYPVAMGATAAAPDLSVVGMEHPEMVFRKDRVRGTMIIRDGMPAGQPLAVRIEHDDTLLWEQQLLTENSGQRRIDFEFEIEELVKQLDEIATSDVKQHAVPLNLVASITPMEGEAELDNNQRSMRLAATTENQRMLIIDGRSRWETRYLRNVFERDSQWDVSVIIAGPGNDTTTLPRGDGENAFPETREALFAYDLIIFGEVSAELFADHEFQWICDFVEKRGGGLILVDGHRKRMRQFTDQNLGPLVPIEWQPEPVAAKPTSLQLTNRGASEPALTFETQQQANQQFWTELPAPNTINNVVALPDAETLVEVMVQEKPVPAIVTRRSGAGRVLYLAFDETWRWRYKAADTYHQRIWNQFAKFVMPRSFATSDQYVAIDAGPVSYAHGESADIRVHLNGLDGEPAVGSTVDALLWVDGKTVATVGLSPDPDVPGIYRGRSGELSEGDYEVSVRASGFSDQALKARGAFVVRPPETGELTETACNETLLKQMASDSGGTYLREEEIGRLAELLKPLSSGRVVESETLLWQSYWWFAAIVTLLAVEWFLRKRAGLL